MKKTQGEIDLDFEDLGRNNWNTREDFKSGEDLSRKHLRFCLREGTKKKVLAKRVLAKQVMIR